MFIILFIIFIGIPLLKECCENEKYRQSCYQNGHKTYWSNDGLRYTSNNRRVTNPKDMGINLNKDYYKY